MKETATGSCHCGCEEKTGMKVLIQFISSSVPVVYENVRDVYTKDALLCLSFADCERIIKFPLCNMFSIESDYAAD